LDCFRNETEPTKVGVGTLSDPADVRRPVGRGSSTVDPLDGDTGDELRAEKEAGNRDGERSAHGNGVGYEKWVWGRVQVWVAGSKVRWGGIHVNVDERC
jgi:hypothetical protein